MCSRSRTPSTRCAFHWPADRGRCHPSSYVALCRRGWLHAASQPVGLLLHIAPPPTWGTSLRLTAKFTLTPSYSQSSFPYKQHRQPMSHVIRGGARVGRGKVKFWPGPQILGLLFDDKRMPTFIRCFRI